MDRVTRKKFMKQAGLSLVSSLVLPQMVFAGENNFEGMVVQDDGGEIYQMRGGTALVKIKFGKKQGAGSVSFVSESFRPGDAIPVHKHLHEDEFIFLHKGSGLLTLGDNQYPVSSGAVAIVPKGVWHGLQNNGTEILEMRFGYTPAGFEGFFRDMGTPAGQPYVNKTLDDVKAISRKWGIVYKK